jgi:RNA polymerase sigma factor (sigma-70 family)
MTEQSSTTVMLNSALARFAAGDAAAKDELIRHGLDRLAAIARKLLRSFGGEQRVELWTMDVFNEAYPRLSKALDDVKPTSARQFFGLARLQMQRALLDQVRKPARPTPLSDGGPAHDDEARARQIADPTNEAERRELMVDLFDAVGALPENEADTVWLKLSGYTHREIGEFLGVHKDTIDRYWNKACVKLARPLGPFLDPS